MEALIKYLSQFITPHRYQLFKDVAANRTRYITPVLEEIYQPHNASAVLRTCDCVGIQDVHIIEGRNRFELNSEIELGAARWLNLIKHNNPERNAETAIQQLKDSGYRIVATTPHSRDVSLEELDLSKGKIALLFGTELNGLTKQAMDLADEYVRIPMTGFTESFNISVSVAIVIYTLVHRLENASINWKLSEAEQNILILDWLRKSIKLSDQLEKRFIFDNQNQEPWRLNQ